MATPPRGAARSSWGRSRGTSTRTSWCPSSSRWAHLRDAPDDGLRREEPGLRLRHVHAEAGGQARRAGAQQLRGPPGAAPGRLLLRGQLPPLHRGHPENQEARGDPGGGLQGDRGRAGRHRVRQRRRQDEEPRLRLRGVREPPGGGHGPAQADAGPHPAVGPPDRRGLGGARDRRGRGRDGDGQDPLRAQPDDRDVGGDAAAGLRPVQPRVRGARQEDPRLRLRALRQPRRRRPRHGQPQRHGGGGILHRSDSRQARRQGAVHSIPEGCQGDHPRPRDPQTNYIYQCDPYTLTYYGYPYNALIGPNREYFIKGAIRGRGRAASGSRAAGPRGSYLGGYSAGRGIYSRYHEGKAKQQDKPYELVPSLELAAVNPVGIKPGAMTLPTLGGQYPMFSSGPAAKLLEEGKMHAVEHLINPLAMQHDHSTAAAAATAAVLPAVSTPPPFQGRPITPVYAMAHNVQRIPTAAAAAASTGPATGPATPCPSPRRPPPPWRPPEERGRGGATGPTPATCLRPSPPPPPSRCPFMTSIRPTEGACGRAALSDAPYRDKKETEETLKYLQSAISLFNVLKFAGLCPKLRSF
ncbi:hypothetical protein ANANG_G00136920 [Anguilla anguilla]|uniref:Uncharacterized protein n=1 Tax=Anguilla anguilla TaxID=7936 RepID=A0A9D3RZU8_ANGAN|nr:hypothetical protein ANANG_G00136920 [Anguilla anguilla]